MNRFLFGILVVSALPACGDDAESATQLDDSKHLSTLSDAELGALCDWSNAQQGGYGKETTCPNGLTVSTQKDQAACKAEDGPTLKKCEQTVAQYKTCTTKIASEPCNLTGALVSQECQPLLPCLAGN